MSVAQHHKSFRLTTTGDPHMATYLTSLGNALSARFEQLGDLDDFNQTVLVYHDAVRLTPDGDPRKPGRLSNLATALRARFERIHKREDLNEAVNLSERAVQLVSNTSERPKLLNNLSLALFHRSERLRDLTSLDRAISTGEDSLNLTPEHHPERLARLNNLALCLLRRFETHDDGNPQDLERSAKLGGDAVYHTPEGHPDKPAHLSAYGTSLGNSGDTGQAISRLSSAARALTGPPHIRFYAAARWAQLAQRSGHSSLMEAYRVALDLLPELAWIGLSIKDRHHHIKRVSKVVRNAATAAIISGSPETAVEWLEQGRSITWGQILNLRTPVDDLKKAHSVLADRFIWLSEQLEESGTQGSEKLSSPQEGKLKLSHDHALERNRLLKEIRKLENFDKFRLPKTTSTLSQAAQKGPVVVVNVSEERCDALIFMPTDEKVRHIFLPEFTPEDADRVSDSLYELVPHGGRTGRNGRLPGGREGRMPPEEEFSRILAELWTGLVKPVLNGLNITTPSTDNLKRIWWCPTGPLTFLPIHAAGIYGKNEQFGTKLSDFAISSYTPSLSALIHGIRPRPESQKKFQLLAVSQPSAEGQALIPGTRQEITAIEEHAAGKVPVVRLDGDMATLADVETRMKDCRWVHFACHGVQNGPDPTESALLVAGNSRLTLSSIIKLSLPEADFAFLSACETATGNKGLQEEAVHLAGGMLSAGYRGVIATMWTIQDSHAPQVAGDVYKHMFQTSPPDSSRAAEALHMAVKKLRTSGKAKLFSHWVPYIHVGI
ncbi:CHAT domain-containing protein [Mycena galericulata]|nr:CHAT domain-containing protein [Mycena galericulata]